MILGDVFYWRTDRAIGHANRDKFHVYICEGNFRCPDHVFLFISKADYGGDYRIEQDPYGFLTLPHSYISCNGWVHYSDAEVARYRQVEPRPVGRISAPHLRELRESIHDSETMEGWQITFACAAITRIVGP